MLWEVSGKPVGSGHLGQLRVHEVLCEYDGPRIFTLIDENDDLYLSHFCDEDDNISRFIVVPFDQELLTKLTLGTSSLLESLQQPRLWVVDCKGIWKPFQTWRSRLDSLPADVLPERDVMLWASLEPLLSLRTIGQSIGEGITPASVITDVIERGKKAVRILVEYVRETGQQAGRPADARRKWYDLPTQRISFASFEVSFRMPFDDEQAILLPSGDEPSKDEVYHQVGELLQRGFKWLESDGHVSGEVWGNEDEKKVVLEAMESLIPSSVGPVKTLEVRGQLVSPLEHETGKPVRLSKESKRFIKAAMARPSIVEERIITERGFIRELDKDRYTFELRKSPDDIQSSIKFSFDEDLADDVNDATYLDQFVEVVGVREGPQKLIRARIVQPSPEIQAAEDISEKV